MTMEQSKKLRYGRTPGGKPDGYTSELGVRLARIIQETRLARGWTQTDLAHVCGLVCSDVGYIEAGHEPKIGRLLLVCRALEIPLDMVSALQEA